MLLSGVAWYILGTLDSASNKIFFVDYPFPVTISLAHMIVNTILFYVTLTIRGYDQKLLDPSFLKYLIPLGFLKVMVSMSSHVSFFMLTVAYAQTIRTLSPLFVILLKKLFYKKDEPIYVYISILLMSVGVSICTVAEYEINILGILASLLMVWFNSLFNFMSKHQITQSKLDPYMLAFNIHLIAVFIVTPIWMFWECPVLITSPKMITFNDKKYFAGIFLTQGLISFGCHLSKFTLLSAVSPVGYSMIDATRSIFKIVVSTVMYYWYHSLIDIMGILVAVIGAGLYQCMKIKALLNEKTE